MTSVGTIIWLSSELMFFAALFAMYFTLRSVTGTDFWHSQNDALNVPVSATNTTILVLSSLTCQLGVFAAERGQVGRTGSVFKVSGWGLREWFTLTYLMGAVFIGGQAFEDDPWKGLGLGLGIAIGISGAIELVRHLRRPKTAAT